MNRLLLTLLALLTGLVTPVASAQAALRAKGDAEISAFVGTSASAQRSGHVAVRFIAQANAGRFTIAGKPIVVPAQPEVRVPAIRVGIDRARE